MAKSVHRKKNCPQCGVEHRGRGPFCSQGCHNRFRGPRSEETKAKISNSKREWYKTPDGMREKEKLIFNNKLKGEGKELITTEDYYIEIPDIDTLGDEKINW